MKNKKEIENVSRRRGRPNKEDPRIHPHTVKLNNEEDEILNALVDNTGLSESEVIRAAILRYGCNKLLKRKKVK